MVLLENLKILVNLAMIDGNMAEGEKTYIRNIAKAHSFPESAAETLFYSSHQIIIPATLTADQKFDYAFTLIQMMKIDERLYPNEIKFCAGIIEKLGYRPEAVGELLLRVGKDSPSHVEITELKKIIATYLK
jgi:uncharacterized tellurite resistance protein B-like protein